MYTVTHTQTMSLSFSLSLSSPELRRHGFYLGTKVHVRASQCCAHRPTVHAPKCGWRVAVFARACVTRSRVRQLEPRLLPKQWFSTNEQTSGCIFQTRLLSFMEEIRFYATMQHPWSAHVVKICNIFLSHYYIFPDYSRNNCMTNNYFIYKTNVV